MNAFGCVRLPVLAAIRERSKGDECCQRKSISAVLQTGGAVNMQNLNNMQRQQQRVVAAAPL